jgi:initiation factor 1A
MPKYLKKCEKKRNGKNRFEERKLIEKDGDNQGLSFFLIIYFNIGIFFKVYGQVQKMFGDGRLLAFCFDGKQRQCRICGRLRKWMWIYTGDIVLIALRDYQDDMVFFFLKRFSGSSPVYNSNGSL